MDAPFETSRKLYQRRLYSYAWYSLRVAADAEDVVQEAFVRLWEHRREVEPMQVGAWLMRVTQNLVTDQIRRRGTRARDEEVDTDLLPAEQPAPADHHHQRCMKALVEECIAALTDPYRTIVIMREIQGLSYQEIADILGISLDHVKTDLFRAKRKLRELVSSHPRYDQHLLED